jgi:ribosomal-protein-alanine N-acetyltransferase
MKKEKLKIRMVTQLDINEVFDFEKTNRTYFESVLPPRPNTYNQLASFTEVMINLLKEQVDGLYYMFLIEDCNGTLVGRINLNVEESNEILEAEVGYRIGENYQGKGYASEALKLIINYAFDELKMNQLSAGTASNNIGSKRVLEKNGFIFHSTEKDVMEINGTSIDGCLYLLKNSIDSIL